MTPHEALLEAIRVLGGQTNLAKACGTDVKQQHVYNWIHRSKCLPDSYGLKIQIATEHKGETVPAHLLCPNAFPVPVKPEESAA